MYAGFALVGVAAFAGVTQQAVFGVAEVRQLRSGRRLGHRPVGLLQPLALLGITIVLLMSLFVAKPVRGVKPNLTPAMAFGFLGSRHDHGRHPRQRDVRH